MLRKIEGRQIDCQFVIEEIHFYYLFDCMYRLYFYRTLNIIRIQLISIAEYMLVAKLILISIIAVVAFSEKDHACKNIHCGKHFRCENGICLKQERTPMKKLCQDIQLNGHIRAIKCTNRNQGKPKILTTAAACGFTNAGAKIDYQDYYSPCQNKDVDYYYRLSCSSAPTVCLQTEDCLNGKCVALFASADNEDRKICNSVTDCKPIVQLCVASKCVKKTQLLAELKGAKPSQTL